MVDAEMIIGVILITASVLFFVFRNKLAQKSTTHYYRNKTNVLQKDKEMHTVIAKVQIIMISIFLMIFGIYNLFKNIF